MNSRKQEGQSGQREQPPCEADVHLALQGCDGPLSSLSHSLFPGLCLLINETNEKAPEAAPSGRNTPISYNPVFPVLQWL